MKKKRILIAAHSATQLEILSRSLSQLNFEVDIHTSLESAKAALNADLGKYCLAIADTSASALDGFSLLRTVRNLDSEFPFILLTAVDSPDWIVKSQDTKATGYLVKPLTIEKVKMVLSRLLPELELPLAG